MKKFYVLSILALTVLSACGNKDEPTAQLSGGSVDNNSIMIPGEEGAEGQANIQMIRAGMHEANEVRQRRGLPRLRHDINLTIAAQQRARQLCNLRGQGPGFPGQGGGFNRGMGGSDADSDSDGVSALPAFGDNQGQGFGRGPRGPAPQPIPQQPQFPQQPGMGMAVENSARGLRDVRQVFAMWQQRQMYAQNLFSPAFHRQGMGYCDGIWIHLLAN